MHVTTKMTMSVAAAMLLAACGGSDSGPGAGPPSAALPLPAPVPAPAPVAEPSRAERLASADGGMQTVVFANGKAYVSVANTATTPSGVYQAALPLQANSTWQETSTGDCTLPRADNGAAPRAPRLRALDAGLWLMQLWGERPEGEPAEHAVCALDTQEGRFTARDAALKECSFGFCMNMSASDMKQVGPRLYTNAGGGKNVLASTDGGVSWRVVTGKLRQELCTDPAFEIVGDRLLVGGECPLDLAFLEAYQLGADGVSLASPHPLPMSLPDLENRNVQFIRAVSAQRVFAGVEGALLRSEDGGRSFKFVIRHDGGTGQYPYIRNLLALSRKPDTIVAGGFDKKTSKPVFTWSADGGTTWTDIAYLLPGYTRGLDAATAAEVTSIVEEADGRLLVTVNEGYTSKGHLVRVTLGTQAP